jgi:hypothetical protein
MNRDIRWRIITLQIVMVVVFAIGGGLAIYAGNFTHDQVTSQLAPQQIAFPADQKSGLPADLQQYAGQQVLNGDQAHAYAEKFIGLHLNTIGQGKPYSYWSGQAMQATDAAKKAQLNATADTLFKGTTLRTMLNQAWAFWTVGDIAMYAGYAFIAGALVVLGTLLFEAFFATKKATEPVKMGTVPASIS